MFKTSSFNVKLLQIYYAFFFICRKKKLYLEDHPLMTLHLYTIQDVMEVL